MAWTACAARACQTGKGGSRGGRCEARQASRTTMSRSTHNPIDLCRLYASARGPTGTFEIVCIHHPSTRRPITATAIAQCRTITIHGYRGAGSELRIRAHTDEVVASRRRLEKAAVGVADDHRADVVPVADIVDAHEFAQCP